MTKRVKIKAYVAGNLGDDLFIELLCSRYPQHNFYLCGSKKFKKIYEENKNLKFISYDTFLCRLQMAVRRVLTKAVNCVLQQEKLPVLATDVQSNWSYEKKADLNVFITGSGFRNGADEMHISPRKRLEEEHYFNLHPYLLGCNFGPYVSDEYYFMYQELFQKAADVCFRDTYSLGLFPMVKTARSAADIVFCYPVDMIHAQERLVSQDYMLISVANLAKDKDEAADYSSDYIEMLRKLVSMRNRKNLHTVLLGFCNEQGDDLVISQVLDGLYDSQLDHVYCYPDIAGLAAIRLIYDANFILATRYHAMILGLLFGKKVCPICYSEKMIHVVNDILPDAKYIALEELDSMDVSGLEDAQYIQLPDERIRELVESANTQFAKLDTALMASR